MLCILILIWGKATCAKPWTYIQPKQSKFYSFLILVTSFDPYICKLILDLILHLYFFKKKKKFSQTLSKNVVFKKIIDFLSLKMYSPYKFCKYNLFHRIIFYYYFFQKEVSILSITFFNFVACFICIFLWIGFIWISPQLLSSSSSYNGHYLLCNTNTNI